MQQTWLGLNRYDSEKGQFTLIFLAAPDESAQVELTYNWQVESYPEGRNFGHLAVDDIYQTCQQLMDSCPPARE